MTETDSTGEGSADEPIACTLTAEEAEERSGFVRSTWAPHVEAIERRDGDDGWTFRVAHTEEAVEGITTFARREHGCCSFAHYEVHLTPGDDPNYLHFYGPAETGELVREGLVDRLVEEFDVEVVA